MVRYALISVLAGSIMLILDAVFDNSEFAKRISLPLNPIRRKNNTLARSLAVNISFGFIFAGFYLISYRSLPGLPGSFFRSLYFATIVWILSVVFKAMSQWVEFDFTGSFLLYSVLSGFIKILSINILFHYLLRPLYL